jgi:quercetin dioxygenase-like cupin family protein
MFAFPLVIAIALSGVASAADSEATASVHVVSSTTLPNIPGNALSAATVDFPPGVASPSHHHAGFVFVYVLAGSVDSQLNDDPPQHFEVGDSWVEPPGTRHTKIVNPSKTDTARILAVFVAPTGAQLTVPN